MRRFLLIAILVLAVLTALTLGVTAWLLNDEEFLKKQISKYTLEYTGRSLVIAGPLKLSFGRETTIEATGITLGNASWASVPHMVEVGHVKATVEIPSLFSDLVYLPYLQVENCAVVILENEAGESNWDFPGDADAPEEEEEAGLLAFALNEVLISDCRLIYNEPGRDSPLDVQIVSATLERALHDRVVGEVSGSVNGEVLEVDGWLAPASAFIEGGEIRHELNFRAGEVTLESSGSIADIKSFTGPDIEGYFRGPDIGKFLEDYSLPPAAEGAFDFRAGITTREDGVMIEIDGDLGNLDVKVDGTLDRLLSPSEGYLQTQVSGPNLQAIGQALDVDNLVREPFSWQASSHFEPGAVVIDQLILETSGDKLEISGTVSTLDQLAGSRLAFNFESDEIGRWSPLVGRAEEVLGAVGLEGNIAADSNGLLSIDTRVVHGLSTLSARGALGSVDGPLEPELDVEFQSTDMPRLAGLIGYQGFPARPVSVTGHVTKKGQSIQFSNLELSLNNSNATASGQLSLAKDLSGSEINADIDIPDIAELGLLFGVDDLVHEPMQVSGVVKLQNGGLVFEIDNGSLGEVRMKLDGHIADLNRPMGIDANIDVSFPGLRFLRIWLPDLALPKGSFAIRGHVINRVDQTVFEDMQLRLAGIEANVSGHVTHDQQFDLFIDATGPDITVLDELVGFKLEDVPFSATSRLAGTPEAFVLDDLEFHSGKSNVRGHVNLELGEAKRVSGKLVSSYINLNPWTASNGEESPPETSRYVFDDTPVARVTDIGMEIDLDMAADELEISNGHYRDVEIGFRLSGQRLEINPFTFTGGVSGTASGELVLDSTGNQSALDLNLQIDNLTSGLGAKEGQDPETLPTANLGLELHGRGRTQREMASSFNGNIRMNMGPGKLAPSGLDFLVSDFASQLFGTLNPYAEKLEYTELECAVAAANIVSGQVEVKPVVVHTRQLTIVSQGKIDLDTERLNLQFNTKQRKGIGISASDLVNPFIKVGGTLAAPSVELDPAGTVVKGGLAVATVGLSIIASSLADRYLSSKDPCGDALLEIEKQDEQKR